MNIEYFITRLASMNKYILLKQEVEHLYIYTFIKAPHHNDVIDVSQIIRSIEL